MTSIVQLPPDVAAALAQEKAYLDQRPKGGSGGGDWDFDKLDAPDAVGQSKVHHRVILPSRLPMTGLPWKHIPQHTVMAQGNTTSVTCPHRYQISIDPSGNMGPPPPCPLCEASEWMKAHAREFKKDSPENESWWKKGVNLGARERYFANSVDLDNIARHWRTGESGAVTIAPCVLAFGKEMADAFKAIMGECGMFWHPEALTALKVTVTRTGKLEFNIERDVRMVLPAGGYRIQPEGTINYLLQNLNDFEQLVKLLPYDQLKSFVPADARQVQVQVPATPHVPQALPPPLPPPVAALPPLPPSPPVAAPPVPPVPMAPPAPPVPTAPAMPMPPPVPMAPPAPPPPAMPPAAAPAMPSIPTAALAAPPPSLPPMPGVPSLPPMPGVPGVPTAAVGASMPPPPAAPPPMPSPPGMPPMPPMPKIG